MGTITSIEQSFRDAEESQYSKETNVLIHLATIKAELEISVLPHVNDARAKRLLDDAVTALNALYYDSTFAESFLQRARVNVDF